ncbi:MAG: hypothetical protein LIP01_12700 [Tannerellaceae bacterium]|nr:hypothetical protein [Tannerellaceae bacterium]
MKRSLSLILLLFILCPLYATVEVDTYVHTDRVSICLSLNHATAPEHVCLLYKARLEIMGEYIQQKINTGQLEDKRFKIYCSDPVMPMIHLILIQDKDGYYIQMYDFPSLQDLLAYVDYFVQAGQKPFEAYMEERSEEDYEKCVSMIENFYKKYIPAYDVDSFPREMWQLDHIQICYADEKLHYRIYDEVFPVPVNANLPVKIQDRYLLFDFRTEADRIIHVLEGNRIIKTFSFSFADYGHPQDLRINIYPGWVNINYPHGDEKNWLVSYSYNKNTFYKNK